MKKQKISISVEIDKEIFLKATETLSNFSLTVHEAVRLFLLTVVRDDNIVYDMYIANFEATKAQDGAQDGSQTGAPPIRSMEELLEDIKQNTEILKSIDLFPTEGDAHSAPEELPAGPTDDEESDN